MASAYALAILHRSLRLSWDFMLPASVHEKQEPLANWSAASTVCWQLLKASNSYPTDRWGFSAISCIDSGHCFFCKTPFAGTRGLVESCKNCHEQQLAMPEYLRRQYAFCFRNTLDLSKIGWKLDPAERAGKGNWYDRLVPAPPAPPQPQLTKVQAMILAAKKHLSQGATL